MQEYYFSGTIERVIFENASNFFRILLLEIDETDSDFEDYEIIVTGTMGDVMEGEDYTFWGQLTNHPKYGEQLQMTRYERSKPSASGLIKYFSSDNFKGIGKKTAERIVEIYGEDPIDKILEDPSKLEQIPNLSKVNREAFVAKLKINYGTEQILSKLSSYGLTPKAASQIFNQYKEESLNLIEEHPYLLVEEVQGIGFKIADQLAERLGIASDAPERLRAALIHCLLEASMEEGDTYIEAKALLERTIILLESARQIELDPALVANQLTNLIQEDKVQNVETKIFDNTLYFAEQGIYTHLTRIMKDQPDISAEDKIQVSLEEVEEELGITYDKVQKDAIIKALQSKVFILTGGPGTGKTTVINGIIKTYADLHGLDFKKSDLPIILAAPTGRAARRMNELTQLPSATIHRHLGLNSEDDFKTLEDYLDCDLIIIDEFSMVDTWLANQLFESISDSTQVIIVGDQDQLPSVGPGQVLADLLQIDNLPKVSLTKIFRQSEDSTIVTLASRMRQGQLTISIPLCRTYLILKKRPISLPLMIFSSVRTTKFSIWSTIPNSMSSMATSASLPISSLVNILKASRTKFTCPLMAMRLSILVTNGIRLLWPMPCQSTNLKGVSSQSLSFPSHDKVDVCYNVTSSTPLSHAPRVN